MMLIFNKLEMLIKNIYNQILVIALAALFWHQLRVNNFSYYTTISPLQNLGTNLKHAMRSEILSPVYDILKRVFDELVVSQVRCQHRQYLVVFDGKEHLMMTSLSIGG